MSRRVVVLVVLGLAVGSCALGLGLWFSRGAGHPQRVSIDVSHLQVPHRAFMPSVRVAELKQMRGLFVLPARAQPDHRPYIALAGAGGGLLLLVVIAAGFVYFRRRRRPYFDFS